MSEVGNIGENQPNAVQKATAAETTSSEPTAAAESMPASTPTLTQAELETETDKQVGNNADEAAAGDAGTSAVEAAKPAESSPKVENKKTPAKRTPSKRMSFIERAQKESEELVKNMGGSLELEGGRRTRSSARGTPTRAAVVSTPPPAKKARSSPANAGTTPSRGRGRGRKIDISAELAEEKAKKDTSEKSAAVAPADVKSAATSEITDKDKSTAENAESATTEPKANTDITDVAPATETSKEPQDQEEKSTEKDTVAEKSEDKPDATLEPVPEEKQNNVDHAVERKHSKVEAVLAADSPMETDEQPDEPVPVATTSTESAPVEAVIDAKATETPAVAEVTSKATVSAAEEASASASSTAAVDAVKEPTPEPMEVDSSSKSNDAVELIETTASQPSVVSEVNSTPAAAVEQGKLAEAPNAVQNNAEENAKESVEVAAVIGETTSVNATALDTGASAVEECTKIAPAPVSAPAATDATSENNKGQNDFCEPKITSPSINASSNDGAVTTPQFCN